MSCCENNNTNKVFDFNMDDDNKRLSDRELGLQRDQKLAKYYADLRRQQENFEVQENELSKNPEELLKRIKACHQGLQTITWAICSLVFIMLLTYVISFYLVKNNQTYKPESMESNHAALCYLPASSRGGPSFRLETSKNKFIRIYDDVPRFEFLSDRYQVQIYPTGFSKPKERNLYIDTILERGGRLNSKWPTCVRIDGIKVKVIYLKRMTTDFDVQYLPMALWFNQVQLIDNMHLEGYEDIGRFDIKSLVWFYYIFLIFMVLVKISIHRNLKKLKSLQS